MLKYKKQHEKGKFSFTKYFQEFKEGDSVAVTRELGLPFGYQKKLQGRTGKILSKRGRCYTIAIKDLNKVKEYNIHPVHLRRIQQ
jgi:ribosomal protein L21E